MKNKIITPLVTIAIPTYNRSNIIENSIKNALSQTYSKIEVIVVDDSTDNLTKEICESYEKIRYFKREKKNGIASADNDIIDMMNGEWLKPISDDNLLKNSCIERFVTHSQNTDKMILFSDYDLIDSTYKKIGIKNWPNFHSKDEWKINSWFKMIGNPDCAFFKKDCFRIVGKFDPQFESAFDYEWWLRASIVENLGFHHIPENLLQIMIHPEQASFVSSNDKNYILKVKARQEKIRNHVKDSLKNKNFDEWKTFSNQLKKFMEQKNSFNKDQNIKKIYRILPSNLQYILKRIKNKEFSKNHVQCPICKIKNVTSFIHYNDSKQNYFCSICETIFDNNYLKTFKI
jgi:glycosyltransferase involved in cell wall biosynthesis